MSLWGARSKKAGTLWGVMGGTTASIMLYGYMMSSVERRAAGRQTWGRELSNIHVEEELVEEEKAGVLLGKT